MLNLVNREVARIMGNWTRCMCKFQLDFKSRMDAYTIHTVLPRHSADQLLSFFPRIFPEATQEQKPVIDALK